MAKINSFFEKSNSRRDFLGELLSNHIFPFLAYQHLGFFYLDCRNSMILFANMEEKPYICKCKNDMHLFIYRYHHNPSNHQ